MRGSPVTLALAALLTACMSEVPAAAPSPSNSILTGSSPAAGSIVRGEIDELQLHFNPPARLDEVTVSGPGGTLPTMIHAVGEVADYSIPLSGLGPGVYTVSWRATAKGREYRGSFGFTAK
jgi:methionine-rich copper-binding protein CopC